MRFTRGIDAPSPSTKLGVDDRAKEKGEIETDRNRLERARHRDRERGCRIFYRTCTPVGLLIRRFWPRKSVSSSFVSAMTGMRLVCRSVKPFFLLLFISILSSIICFDSICSYSVSIWILSCWKIAISCGDCLKI